MIKNKQKGFTLLEILVVVAIIAVLASIVLINVNPYVEKGKDSNIMQSVESLAVAAAGFYDSGTNYSGFCDSESAIKIKNAMPLAKNCNVSEDGSAYVFCAQKTYKTNKAWCVDSTGIKREISNSNCTAEITACPAE